MLLQSVGKIFFFVLSDCLLASRASAWRNSGSTVDDRSTVHEIDSLDFERRCLIKVCRFQQMKLSCSNFNSLSRGVIRSDSEWRPC